MGKGKPLILIADDDSEDRFIMGECFKDMDHAENVVFAEDGICLLACLEETDVQNVSLIVLDLNMPRLNGTETLRALKASQLYVHIPVIIFSTSVNEIEKATCMELGAIEYLTKPTKWDMYVEACKQLYEMCCKEESGVN